jgi:excisionase family DNA binding protein
VRLEKKSSNTMQKRVTIELDVDELTAIVEKAVARQLRQHLLEAKAKKEPKEATETVYLSARQAGQLVSVSPRAIQNAARNGDIPKFMLGGAVRFHRNDVLKLVTKKELPKWRQAAGI